MPVLPKLAKRGVFGKNAILEMSLNPRKCGFVVVPSVSDGVSDPLSERGRYTGTGCPEYGAWVSKIGFVVVPSVSDGVSDPPLRERVLHRNRMSKMGLASDGFGQMSKKLFENLVNH